MNPNSKKCLFAKNELKHIAFSSFRMCNKRSHKFENITKSEHQAFVQLLDNDNIIIQKADKGNVIVIIDKMTYFAKMNDILSDESKFKKVSFCQKCHKNKELDYILEKEEEILNFSKMDDILSDGTKFRKMSFCQTSYKNQDLDYILEKRGKFLNF